MGGCDATDGLDVIQPEDRFRGGAALERQSIPEVLRILRSPDALNELRPPTAARQSTTICTSTLPRVAFEYGQTWCAAWASASAVSRGTSGRCACSLTPSW